MELIKNFWNDEEGQGMAEYALIIALVAIVLIGALGILKGGIDRIFTETGGILNSAADAVE